MTDNADPPQQVESLIAELGSWDQQKKRRSNLDGLVKKWLEGAGDE